MCTHITLHTQMMNSKGKRRPTYRDELKISVRSHQRNDWEGTEEDEASN